MQREALELIFVSAWVIGAICTVGYFVQRGLIAKALERGHSAQWDHLGRPKAFPLHPYSRSFAPGGFDWRLLSGGLAARLPEELRGPLSLARFLQILGILAFLVAFGMELWDR